ncbi:nuclear transport factor 2 family protein [Herbiconiux sp. CPCC 205763]|uniref:Nuclear transport factor 2 family protein n=1 Tax=Herbiconiux aconitum TaxID=2970913 RepID=A0ABT2GQI7_9MICO|nr:nuclear transport factor 2 family protein [Herbiconiux aconitum]MCS5717555.1 nuclear transport factor 2 family protein [Herbiconiux aconitum]
MPHTLPSAIDSMIAATNSADDAAFLAAFAEDAEVADGDRVFHGREGAARWNASDNIGVGMHYELVSWSSVGKDAYEVILRARSRRFSGTGTLRIAIRDGLISAMAPV